MPGFSVFSAAADVGHGVNPAEMLQEDGARDAEGRRDRDAETTVTWAKENVIQAKNDAVGRIVPLLPLPRSPSPSLGWCLNALCPAPSVLSLSLSLRWCFNALSPPPPSVLAIYDAMFENKR